MAQFGANVTEANPIATNNTVKEGIVREPTALQGAARIFGAIGEYKDQQNAKAGQKALADFTNKQLSIIQAVDQGVPGYNSQFARTQIRQNLISMVNNYPGLQKEILQANSTILGQAGMGDIVTDGTREEILRNDLRQKAVEAGYVAPEASDAEQDRAVLELQKSARLQQEYQLEKDAISLQKARLDLTSTERRELQEREKVNAERALIGLAPSELQGFNSFTSSLMSDPNLSQAEKLTALETRWAEMEAGFSGYVAGIDNSTKSNALLKTFETRKALAERLIKGELKQEEYDRKIKSTTSLIQQGMLEDQNIANAVAVSDLFGNNIHPSVQMDVQRVVADWFNSNLSETKPAANLYNDDTTSTETYLDMVSEVDPENEVQVEEQATHLRKILEGAEDYSNTLARNPKFGNSLIEWMASPAFMKARDAHPEEFTNIESLQNVLELNYADEVWGMVRREFRDKTVAVFQENVDQSSGDMRNPMTVMSEGGTVQEVEASQAITFDLGPSGISFKAIEPGTKEIDSQVRELNRKLKPIINRTARAFAHLEGRTDYGAVLQTVMDEMFMSNTGPAGGDTNDDLDLSDFSVGGALDEALTVGGYVGSGDYKNQETPEDVAASFVGLNESDHEDIISSFIAEAAGTKLNPKKTAWCAAFVNAALGASGGEGTGKLNARSFLQWGESTTSPKKGDIVVLERGNEPWMGHVGFFAGRNARGDILVLGGNQGNKVSIQAYPPAKLLGYRRGKAKT